MSAAAPAPLDVLAAMRGRLGLVALLLGLTGLAWWSSAASMSGMQAAPTADLGTLGWFVGVWIVMMAAMMFPSVAPTVVLYARLSRRRGLERPLLFTAAYLLVWGAGGLLAYGLVRLGRTAFGGTLNWHSSGRWLAGGVLVLAAAYELTPLKHACLRRCRSPLGFLLGTWRDGNRGALEMGARHASWCVGCCWALMAALFALGVMSLVWMGLVAALIAFEKMLPWRRVATWGTAVALLVLAVLAVVVLSPAGGHAMTSMPAMG